jgi:threonine/homoserine/homoserine lactone efflux protein
VAPTLVKIRSTSPTWAERAGFLAPLLLGGVFAMSFCPLSAALFFGTLIPLSAQYNSPFVLPTMYGVGTGLPVVGFAILFAFGTNAVAKAYNRITQFEWWARRVTGVVFIAVGAYYLYQKLM